MAYSYAKPLTGESLMMKRWRVLSELFAAKPVDLSHYVSDGGACANCNHALIEHKGGRQCPSHAIQPSVAGEGDERAVSGLELAVIGRKHFGNPIPKAWYAAARELIATLASKAASTESK